MYQIKMLAFHKKNIEDHNMEAMCVIYTKRGASDSGKLCLTPHLLPLQNSICW